MELSELSSTEVPGTLWALWAPGKKETCPGAVTGFKEGSKCFWTFWRGRFDRQEERLLTLKGRGGGHNFKTFIFQKMSPLTYPEN